MGKTSEIEEAEKFHRVLEDRTLEILAERSKLTKTAIRRKWKKTDWWLSALDALEHGFTDEVGYR